MARTAEDGRNKRNQLQKEADYLLETELRLKGYTYQQIAEAICKRGPYTLSSKQVEFDLRKQEKRWQDSGLYDRDVERTKELARIEQRTAEAWMGYARSCEEREERTERRESEDGETKQVIIRTLVRDGNPLFLAELAKCSQDRRKLLGLDEPTKIDVNGWRQKLESYGIDPDTFKNSLVERGLAELRRAAGLDDSGSRGDSETIH